MRALLRVVAPALVAGLALLVARPVASQTPTVVKFPGGPEVVPIGPGQFQAFSGAVIRWYVVYDNLFNTSDVVFDYYDVMDPAGRDTCGTNPVCGGAQHLLLLCDPPNAPDADGGTVLLCDPALGRLDLRGIPVAANSTSCVQFSTRVRDSARGYGSVENQGCVTVVSPIPSTTFTRRTDTSTPSCFPAPSSPLSIDCSRVLVPNIEPPSFTNQKTAAVEDVNGNGINDVGDRITWTVVVTNTGTQAHDGWIYDPIPAGTTFVDIVDNPSGACSLGTDRIDCTVLNFAPGEAKTLTFRTDIDCSIVTDDDSSAACNTAYVCNDSGYLVCAPSDPDLALPQTATCVPVPLPDMTASTKAWTFDDLDADGALSTGDRVNFLIELHNDGTGTATGVQMTDLLDVTCFDETTVSAGAASYDPATDTVSWGPGDMAPGGFEQTTLSALVIDTGAPCCNQGAITYFERFNCGKPDILTDDPATAAPDDPSCLVFGPQPVIEAEKDFTLTNDADGDGVPSIGDELTFTITVRNVGGGAATNVVIDDLIFPCWTGFTVASIVVTGTATDESTEQAPPATPNRVRFSAVGGADGLDPNGTETVTITFPLTIAPGWPSCCNEAHVTWAESAVEVTTDDPTTPTQGDPTCTDRTAPTASIQISKSAAEFDPDGCLRPGEDVIFTITMTAHDADANLVQVDDVVTDTAGVFDAVDAGGGTLAPGGDGVHWDIAALPLGATLTRTWIGRFACDAPAGSTVEDIATAFAINADPSSSAPVTSTLAGPDLRVSKVLSYTDADLSGTLSAGDTASFAITVQNLGTCDATNVVIRDVIDPDMDVATIAADGAPSNVPAGTLQWDATTTPELAVMAPSDTHTYNVSVVVLDPGTNPDPAADGIVENRAQATADAPPACPIDARSALISEIIDVDTAHFDVELTAVDDDLDGCFEPGEPVNVHVKVTPVGGAADGVTVVLSFTDAADVLSVLDAGGGSVAGNPEAITWTPGTMTADTSVEFVATMVLRCDGPDGALFGAQADVTSVDLPPASALVDRLRYSQPTMEITKAFTWLDDGDGIVEAGESLKYNIDIRNVGTCQLRNLVVVDVVDPDLDRAAMTFQPYAENDGAGGLSWLNLGLNPGESMTLTIEAPVLDPATNTDPAADGRVNNESSVVATTAYACPAPAWTARAPEIVLGRTFGVVKLLRNDFVTCRNDAFATMKAEFMRQRPVPQECSEPPAIDPAHRGTQVLTDAVSPALFTGDADPAATLVRCPQTLVGFGRVLVFYELDEPAPACITTLRVRKTGTDVEVSW